MCRPITDRAGRSVRYGKLAHKAEGLSIRLGDQHHIAVIAGRQLSKADLAVNGLKRPAVGPRRSSSALHRLPGSVQHSGPHQTQAVPRRGQAILIRTDEPIARDAPQGYPRLRQRDTPLRNTARRVCTVEHTIGVIGQQHCMGTGTVIRHDPFRMLHQKVDQGLGLLGCIPGQDGVSHLHCIVCKVMGQPTGPGRRTDTVLGNIKPIFQAIHISPAAQHHSCRSQRTGPALALLKVEPGIHIQADRQRSGQTVEHKKQRQQQRCKPPGGVLRFGFHGQGPSFF